MKALRGPFLGGAFGHRMAEMLVNVKEVMHHSSALFFCNCTITLKLQIQVVSFWGNQYKINTSTTHDKLWYYLWVIGISGMCSLLVLSQGSSDRSTICGSIWARKLQTWMTVSCIMSIVLRRSSHIVKQTSRSCELFESERVFSDDIEYFVYPI